MAEVPVLHMSMDGRYCDNAGTVVKQQKTFLFRQYMVD
jgi:hypothetical protein